MSAFRDISRDPNTPKSNQALEDALNEITDPSLVREKVLQVLHQQGQVIYTRDDEFKLIRQQPSEPPPAVVMPASPANETCGRVIYVGNDRYEFYGQSESALDERERQIRSLFGGRR